VATITKPAAATDLVCGADIVVQSLINHGVDVIFAYPGGASMPLHQSLVKYKDKIRTILPRHEQGGGFAAQGYTRSTGKVGVCMGTSGPGATNLVTVIADAKLDSIPMVILTGQVKTPVIGSDAFQETPIVEVCRGITKHHYLVTDVKDVARVMREAFHIATSGRPGPVLVDLPKDVQQFETVPNYEAPMNLPGYHADERRADPAQLKAVAELIKNSKKPMVYAGGGIIAGEASAELRAFVKKTGIPTTMTLMGLGTFPSEDPLCLDMLGMHGSVYSNYAVEQCDLLLAFGVRFDDRVTGKLAEFAKFAKIVHIDIDPSELHKNKPAMVGIVSDIKYALKELNKIVVAPADISGWVAQVQEWKKQFPYKYDKTYPGITQQHAISELNRLTRDRDPIIAVGVGQHQMWSAQWMKFNKPRTWLSSSGLGTMGFGLPAAMGAKVANPDRLVIDIDGDGSFQMNIQELGTCFCEKIPVKVLLLNNQHLGMVVQWEDRFHDATRAHTYLGPIDHPEASGAGDGYGNPFRYPNFVAIAKAYGWGAKYVKEKVDLAAALQEMIDYDGPYLLDVQVPYTEHVLPMIPGGMTVRDIIMD